jgi:hypothetical protein
MAQDKDIARLLTRCLLTVALLSGVPGRFGGETLWSCFRLTDFAVLRPVFE